MKLIANHQLVGDYGSPVAEEVFETDDQTALHLIRNQMARKFDPPRIEYQTKVIKPEAPEVSPREPFCDSPVPHEKPPTVAPESAPSISAADVPEQADARPRRRGRRPRSGS